MKIRTVQGFFRYPAVLICCGLILGSLLIGTVYNVSGTSGLPDLTGTWSRFSWTPDGLMVKGILQVSNIGKADAGGFNISFYLSNDGSSLSQLLQVVPVFGLKEGQLEQIPFRYQSPTSLFHKSIIAFIDSGNVIKKSSKSNNKAAALISSEYIPFADAGPGQTITTKQMVYLDGSKSTDPYGWPLMYIWSFVSVPKGSHAFLSQPYSPTPTFIADLPGSYVVQLTVKNWFYSSTPDTVTITTGNTAPVANAGPDQTAHAGQTITLDGSKSSDVNGDRITYQWSFASIPNGSRATLSDETAVRPSFEVDVPGDYVAQLIVNDGTSNSSPALVSITTGKIPPVTNAGPGQAVKVWNKVTLDGSKSWDTDGDSLTYHWSLISQPLWSMIWSMTSLQSPNVVSPTFIANEDGIYIAQLYVNDGYMDSFPQTVVISTSYIQPVANAGAPQTVALGHGAVTLDGSKSYEADGSPLTCKWSILYAPSGSSVALSNTTAVKPTFTPDLAGEYVFQLIVSSSDANAAKQVGASNGTFSSAPDTVLITVLTTVPNVVGMSQSGATSAITAAGLTPGEVTTQNSNRVAAGDVISESPAAGASVTASSSVALVVSLGPVMMTVPNVVGMGQSDATSAITAAGLTPGKVTSQNSSTMPVGMVISETPSAGAFLLRGSSVALIVSLGPVMVTVPDVTGKTQNDASTALSSVGLAVGTVTTSNSSTVPTGDVISENPSAATSVPQGSSVALVVSLGPVKATVPNVVGMPQGDAASAIAKVGLTVGAVTTQNSGTVPAGNVISGSPSAGTSIILGYGVYLVVSAGPPPSPPPDPSTVATAIDPTVATTIGSATSFLYTGSNPIQTGVSTGTIQAQQAAVIRGKVLTGNGNALPGVTISILSHPEFGQTSSRSDGMFDLAVNGGGPVTVNYQISGYLPVHRQVTVPWQDYAIVPDAVMIQVDSKVSAIDLTASTPIQVARGSTVTDTDGARTATLLVPQGTSASIVFPDGTTQPLSTLNVRATEYTVGSTGVKAMPGPLPPTSGYTYAIELSSDEALSAGAQTVTFNSPIFHYVENFLNFPVGTAVPVGYYDRTKGQWVGSPNGLVIKLLSITNGMADLDVDGSNQAASVAALSALSITDAERTQLASLYGAGQNLWRVPIPHFSPWDFNWPFAPPPDAQPPNQSPPVPNLIDRPCIDSGSIIGCESQTLGENVSITGTGLKFHYQNDRQVGHTIDRTIEIPLTGPSVPASLKRVDLIITVAGRTFNSSYPASPNQETVFTWDGLDAYNRTVQGAQPVTIQIGYVYSGVYLTPSEKPGNGYDQLFGHFSYYGTPATGDLARQEVSLWQNFQSSFGLWDAKAQGLGGWTLNVHHFYDVSDKKLYLGDGSQESAGAMTFGTINKVAGADVYQPIGVAVGPDGSIYIADAGIGYNHIGKVGTDGIMTTIAGNGSTGSSGDGGPATQASLGRPIGVAVGLDGSIYIADTGNNRVRKVGTDGIITTVAGNGSPDSSGDGGPATQAGLHAPIRLAVGPDGSIYIVGGNSYAGGPPSDNRVRKVGTDGIITTVAGNGSSGYSGDGGSATQASLNSPFGVAIGPDGSIYFSDLFNYCVRKVDTDGIITTVAGNGTSNYSGDGGPATQASIDNPTSVAIGPDGSIYIESTNDGRIRKVDASGIITTVAGKGGSEGLGGDGGPATQAGFWGPYALAVGPDGSIYTADTYNGLRRVAPVLPGFSTTDLLIPSEDGSEIYIFDSTGKHLSTVHPLTGATLYQFAYDSFGHLASVTDGSGKVLTISHDGNGNPTSITAPFGQQTVLTKDSNGYLASITDPAGNAYNFTYAAGGLMVGMTTPNNGTYQFTYDAYGRLTQDSDPAGGSKSLARTDNATGYSVAVTTGLNRITNYSVQQLSTGAIDRVVVSPDGTRTEEISGTDGSENTSYPDGTTSNVLQGPDPRFGMLIPLPQSATVTTPGGLSLTTAMSRTVVTLSVTNPMSLTGQVDTLSINGQNYQSSFSASNNTFTTTSPTGRQVTSTIDNLGRVSTSQIAGLAPTSYAYDSNGRLSTVTAGTGANTRTAGLVYDPNTGYLTSVTDSFGRSLALQYDAAGRVTSQTLPDGSAIGFQYDGDGNLTSITPPGRPAHTFTYTSVDQTSVYSPPGGSATSYSYNIDRQLVQITRPDGETLNLTYDTGGKLSTLTIPSGELTYGYIPTTGNLVEIVTSDGITLAFTYDGFLPKTQTWSGAVSGQVGYTYDNNFRVTSINVNGANAVSFQYDADSLLTQAGSLSLTRDAQSGLVTATALGNVTDALTYNGFGEVATYTASYSGSAVFSTQYTRDQLGRITEKSETINGTTNVFDYTYDQASRLTQVQENGSIISSYAYDANGNRLSQTNYSVTVNGTYDDQDRLTQYGSTAYTYTGNGELLSKSIAGTSTAYLYDVLGNLKHVTLPNGNQIDYVIDGSNRRIGKMLNGTLVQGFLYQDSLKPVAELDGNNNVVSRFIYATGVNVPAYMIKNGVTYRLITDHLGSPRLVLDVSAGAVAQQMDYDEFGNVINDTNPGFQPFGFAGGIYDRDTGFVRFGARDYDSNTGRWTAKDPIGFVGGINMYAYAVGNPVSLVDLTGFCPNDSDPHNLWYKFFHSSPGQILHDSIEGDIKLFRLLGDTLVNNFWNILPTGYGLVQYSSAALEFADLPAKEAAGVASGAINMSNTFTKAFYQNLTDPNMIQQRMARFSSAVQDNNR